MADKQIKEINGILKNKKSNRSQIKRKKGIERNEIHRKIQYSHNYIMFKCTMILVRIDYQARGPTIFNLQECTLKMKDREIKPKRIERIKHATLIKKDVLAILISDSMNFRSRNILRSKENFLKCHLNLNYFKCKISTDI